MTWSSWKQTFWSSGKWEEIPHCYSLNPDSLLPTIEADFQTSSLGRALVYRPSSNVTIVSFNLRDLCGWGRDYSGKSALEGKPRGHGILDYVLGSRVRDSALQCQWQIYAVLKHLLTYHSLPTSDLV